MNNYSNNKKLFVLSVAILVSSLGLFSNAYGLTISPVRIEVAGDPGQTLSKEMVLVNENNIEEIFYPSFNNFEARGESGDPAFVEPRDGLGAWISTVPSISLKAGESKLIPFTITIPKDAEPGGHFAVIFWGTDQSKLGEINIGAKIGLLVLLSVNGDVKEEAGLLGFNTLDNQTWYNSLPVSFEYRFKNDGGDRIKPQGEIIIRNTVFLATEHLDANPIKGNVLPKSARKFKVAWIKYEHPKDYVAPTGFFKKFWSDARYQWKNFAVGLYSAKLNLEQNLTEKLEKETIFFFVFPWQLLIVIFVILLGGGFVLIAGIKRYNRWIVAQAQVIQQTNKNE